MQLLLSQFKVRPEAYDYERLNPIALRHDPNFWVASRSVKVWDDEWLWSNASQ